MDPIDTKRIGEELAAFPVSQQRETVREEVRRFGDFDEISESLETLQMVGGKVEQVDVKTLVFRIKREPEEAEAVQAGLDPDRIRKLIVD